MYDENEYKVIGFLKKNIGIASVLLTLSGIIITAIGNYYCYIMNYAYFSGWNIPEEFIPHTKNNQLHIILCVFIIIVLTTVISIISIRVSDDIFLKDKLIEKYKIQIKKLNKRLKIQKKEQKINEDLCNEITSNNLGKEESETLELIKKTLNDTNTQILGLSRDIKILKHEVLIKRIKIIMAYSIGALGCCLISLIYFSLLFCYMCDSISDLKKILVSFSVPILVVNIFYIVLNKCINSLKVKKHKYNNTTEDISSEIEDIKSRIIEKNNRSFVRFLSDASLKKGIFLLIYFIIILLILLPFIARNGAKNKDTYNIVYKDGMQYAVIFSNGEENVLKRCEIDNDTIKIDDNSFTICDCKNIEYHNIKFCNVIICDIGN